MYAVIDLGGTSTSIVTCESTRAPEFTTVSAFPTDQNYARQLEQMLDSLLGIRPRPAAIALAIGVQLTPDGLAVDESWTMPDYSGRPIVTEIAAATGLPVRAANDNVCGVLAESLLGVLRPWRRTAYLTVSTGTGAGIYLDAGKRSIAWLAQVGHHVVNMHGLECSCGQRGCVQTVTGGQQFLRRFGMPASEIRDAAVWREVTETLAVAIVNLARITRVEALCVSGGIGHNNAWIRASLADRVRKLGPALKLRVMFSRFGEQAPVTGAALLLTDQEIAILH